jgi:hypothetical protein
VPVGQRFGPRQGQQPGRVVGGRGEDEPHSFPGPESAELGR